MSLTEIIVTNQLETGTSFGITTAVVGESVFIPGRLAQSANAKVGGRFIALLVPNGFHADRTPWMAASLEPIAGTQLELPIAGTQLELPLELPIAETRERADIKERASAIILAGGVWTVGSLFAHLCPGESRSDDRAHYNAITATLSTLHKRGECSRFELRRTGAQDKGSRQWFTRYPEQVDLVMREKA